MSKPCRNSRWLGPPRDFSFTMDDGRDCTITEQPYEIVPDYGRNSLTARTINGFNPDDQQEQIELSFRTPTPETCRARTDPHNPACPLSRFIGNENAKERLSRAAYAAWGRINHCCSDQSFALLGPSSVGKTTLSRLFGETLRIPFVEVHPKSVRDTRDLFKLIEFEMEETIKVFDGKPVSLKMVRCFDDPTMWVPPCVVFIDEVHALPRNVVTELLKATDPNNGMMVIENGWFADCRKVCWIIATTERGLLFPPFENRFRKIHLEMYGSGDIARIVQLNHPDWGLSVCRLVAQYSSRVPREALAFAADMQLEHQQNGGNGLEQDCRKGRSK